MVSITHDEVRGGIRTGVGQARRPNILDDRYVEGGLKLVSLAFG